MTLGRSNVNALARSLTARQFLEWEHFDQLEPIGDFRADIRAAQIVTMIANVNRGKDQRPYKIEDFLLKFTETESKKRQTPEEQLMMLCAMFGVDRSKLKAEQ